MAQYLNALPVNSTPPADWWRRVSTVVNAMLGSISGLYQRQTTSVTSNYSASDTDYALIVNSTAGAVSITLPPPIAGRELVVKRINAGGNTITLTGQVDGATSLSIGTQWQSYVLIGNGDRWLVAARHVP